jgi:hypothetical protein
MTSVMNPANKTRIWSTASFVLALLGTSLGAVAAPSQPVDEGLFSGVTNADGSPAREPGAAGDPTVIRSRLVTVDLAQLGAADRLVLNFFADAVYTAALDRVESSSLGAFSWVGNLEGVEFSQVILTVKDGVMVGNVVAPGMFYQVRYVGDGVHAVREADQATFPPEAEPIPVAPPEGAWDQPIDGAAADDGSTIDVLVVYTDDARAQVGGTAAIEAMIATAETETNAGYANSGITQRINVVHTAEISYNESSFDWNTTLSRFRTHGDGYFDAVTQLTTGLRDAYLADESVLIVKGDLQYCGIAYLMSPAGSYFASSAFAVVAYNCATGYYSFGHEMGHNMGAHHDRANASGPGAYSYSYGYQAPDKAFRTVMAYNCTGGGCPRINYWSNPDVSYGGQPTGIIYTDPNSADNRRTLNNTAYTVANFRAAPNPPRNPSPANGATGQSVNTDLGWAGGDPDPYDTVTYDVYLEAGDATPDNVVCGGGTTTTCDPGSLVRGAHYYWRVVATDSHGASTTGPVWDFYVNRLPNAPTSPTPSDGAIGQGLDMNLSWTGGDPDAGDTVTYDAYFRESASTYTRICDDVTAPSCDPGTLAPNAHYYWYVVAFDNHGEFTVGPTWEFYAITNDPPYIPSFPLPAVGVTGESVDVDLAWTGGDPDAGDTVTYTVYLDTSTTPTTQRCQSTSTTCDPGSTLLASTHYYWRVVATDRFGESTPSPVWDFTTGTATGPTIRGYVRNSFLTALEGITITFSEISTTTTTTGSDGYYAKTGFGSGTVTVTVKAAGYTFSPWLDQVTLSGDVTHHITGYALTPTSLLFYDGFESGSYRLGSEWAVETDYEGRVRVSTSYPAAGNYSLLLDDGIGPGDFTSHASAILALDLSGETEVKLGFRWRDFSDDDDPDDGVFISDDDGATWHQVFAFVGTVSQFTYQLVDLDEQASAAGMNLNDHFLVKFQFYDNWPVPTDGYAIDDVVVYSDRYNTHLPLILKE